MKIIVYDNRFDSVGESNCPARSVPQCVNSTKRSQFGYRNFIHKILSKKKLSEVSGTTRFESKATAGCPGAVNLTAWLGPTRTTAVQIAAVCNRP